MLKKFFKGLISPIVLFFFIILFLFAAMMSMFDMVRETIRDFFSFDTDIVSANAIRIEEFIEQGGVFKDGYEDYLNENNMSVYIDNEKKGYLESVVTKKTIVRNGVTSYEDLVLDLSEQKYNYFAPWQLFMLIDFFSDDSSFGKKVHSNVGLAHEKFSPKFYGLKTPDGKFKYNAVKTVEKTVVREEYQIVDVREDGSDVYEWVIVSDTTYETIETTPLPYFDKIESYDNIYEYTYETEETSKTKVSNAGGVSWRTTTTTVTNESIPKLKETTVTSTIGNFYTELASIIGYLNVDAFAECYAYLPYDARLSLVISELQYNGTIFGFGVAGGIPYNHDFTLPSIVSSNNTTISKTEFISISTSILGLPYQWGGKYHQSGLNERWGRSSSGLDCSGFVDWVYTQFGVSVGMSTGQIYANGQSGVLVRVSRNDLKIGDIGLDYVPGGGGNNHTGVVIGFDDGQPLIAHSAGPYWGDAARPTGQVVISKLVGSYRNVGSNTYMGYKPVTFSSFYRVQGLDFR
jgi:cell wall-associated NlpC family hydrolase